MYFAIFAAFKESLTLNLAQRLSLQGRRFWCQPKARTHIPISGQQQLGPYLAPFQRYGGLNVENRHFPCLTPIPAKFGGIPFGVDPSYWDLHAEREKGQANQREREIIFAEFQPI